MTRGARATVEVLAAVALTGCTENSSPGAFTVTDSAVRDGRVWGVYTDELDVESVRAYELAPGGHR